jgi:subtilisin family serine protease
VLVAAAGNDGTAAVEYPAGREEVVSVAATDAADAIAPFSNHNDDVELAAPGVDVVSTLPGNRYGPMSGTSMATPHVAGAAALLYDAHPRSTAATIRERLDAATVDRGEPGRDPAFGFGRLDLSNVGP